MRLILLPQIPLKVPPVPAWSLQGYAVAPGQCQGPNLSISCCQGVSIPTGTKGRGLTDTRDSDGWEGGMALKNQPTILYPPKSWGAPGL